MPRPASASRLRGLRPPRTPAVSDLLLHGGILGVLAILELYARSTRTDVEDAVGVVGLALLASLVRLRHSRRPLRWVAALESGGRRVAGALRLETSSLGIDLRGSPPVARAFPPIPGAAAAPLAPLPVPPPASPALGPPPLRPGGRPARGVPGLPPA